VEKGGNNKIRKRKKLEVGGKKKKKASLAEKEGEMGQSKKSTPKETRNLRDRVACEKKIARIYVVNV